MATGRVCQHWAGAVGVPIDGQRQLCFSTERQLAQRRHLARRKQRTWVHQTSALFGRNAANSGQNTAPQQVSGSGVRIPRMTVQSQVVQGVSPTPPPRMPLPVRLLGGAGLGVGLALGIIAIWSHLAGKRKETDGRPDPFSVDGDVSTAPGTPGQRSYPMLGGASALQAGPAAAHDVLRGSMDSAASVTSAEEEAAAEQERAAARLREEARLSADRADTLAQAQAGEFALKEANSRVDGLEATVMRLRDRLASEAATRMQLQGKMTSLGAARRQNQQMQATVEKLQTDLAQAEAQLRQANDRANELESYVAGLTEKASCVEQRLRELEAQQEEALVQQALQSTENVQFRMAALHHQIHEKEAELADAQLQLNIVQLSLTELEAQAGVGGAPSSHAAEALDVLRHSLEKAHERISSKRTELATLRGDLAAALAQAQHLTAAQSAEVQEVRSSLQSEVLAARADAQAARAELEEMRRKLEARAYPPVAAPAAAVPVISPQDASEETIEEDSSPTDATSAPAAANVSPDSASEEDAIEEADSLAVAESLGAAETAETDAARAEETSKDADGLAMVDSLGAAETAEMDAARAEETSKETVAKSVRQAEIEAARAEAEAARAELERIRLRMEAIQVDAAGARSSSLTSAAETSSSRDSGALPFENAEETSSTLEAQPVSGVTDHRIPTQIPVLAEAQPAADVDQPSATRASEPPRPAEQDSAAGSGPSSDALSKPSPSPNMPSMPELVPMLAVESSAADTPSLPESVLMPAVVSSAAIRLQQQIEARRDAEARLRTQIRLAQDQLREVQETVRAALGPASKKRELALRTQIRQLEADFKRAAADVGAESQMQMVTLELSQAQAALNKLYTSVTRPASLQRTAALKASILEYEQQVKALYAAPLPAEASAPLAAQAAQRAASVSADSQVDAAVTAEQAAESTATVSDIEPAEYGPAQASEPSESAAGMSAAFTDQEAEPLADQDQAAAAASSAAAPSTSAAKQRMSDDPPPEASPSAADALNGAAYTLHAEANSSAQPALDQGSTDPDSPLADEVAELAQRLWESIETGDGAARNSSSNGASTSAANGHAPGLSGDAQLQGAVNQLRLVAAGLTIPHPAKMETGGEDAYFVSSIGMGAVGVADGVGSWAEDGVDPAQYPRLLMKYTEHALVEGHAAGEQATQEALAFAQEATGPLPGSCTACVALLEEGGLMRVANVGDSGFRVVRQGECIYASQVQQHEWNMPFQLASPEILPETDSAQDAEMYELQLQGGDVVVFGTDGLFDNMWDEELAAIVGGRDKAAPMDVHAASAIAGSIARAAHEHSKNTQYRSPWVIEAATKGALSFWERLFPRGGKQDDCTVVVAFVAPAVVPLSSGGGLAGKPRDESQRLQSVGR